MKKIIALLSLLTVFIIACTTSEQTNSLLSKPGDVKADEYSITVDRDTTLVTKNGALLKIPKGTLATDNGNTVALEIKEAYSLEQMIRYGLTTSSGDEPHQWWYDLYKCQSGAKCNNKTSNQSSDTHGLSEPWHAIIQRRGNQGQEY